MRCRHRSAPIMTPIHPVLRGKSLIQRCHRAPRILCPIQLHQTDLYHEKNGTKGKYTGNSCTGHPTRCPVVAMHCHMEHLRHHGANRNTSIASVKYARTWAQVCSADITSAIQEITRDTGPDIGFTDVNISALYLRSGGTMVLLLDKVDRDTICQMGR